MTEPRFATGPPRYFRPVCILHKTGFVGGPSGYVETKEPACEPLILLARVDDGEAEEA